MREEALTQREEEVKRREEEVKRREDKVGQREKEVQQLKDELQQRISTVHAPQRVQKLATKPNDIVARRTTSQSNNVPTKGSLQSHTLSQPSSSPLPCQKRKHEELQSDTPPSKEPPQISSPVSALPDSLLQSTKPNQTTKKNVARRKRPIVESSEDDDDTYTGQIFDANTNKATANPATPASDVESWASPANHHRGEPKLGNGCRTPLESNGRAASNCLDVIVRQESVR
jgi:hypothetical protein